MTMQQIYLAIPLLPLLAAVVIGLFGKFLPRPAAHIVTIAGVAISFVLSVYVLKEAMVSQPYNETVYSWLKSGNFSFEIGFLIDRLSAMMMVVVTFVS
jgi:NADH-quinone oxidoreductase subunit L